MVHKWFIFLHTIFICITLLFLFLSACSQPNTTPLIKSTLEGNLKQIKEINPSINEINQGDAKNLNAFAYSIIYDHPDVLAYFINKGTDPNQLYYKEITPLILAATVGDTRVIKMLHDAGAKINAANVDGVTPLIAAAAAANSEAVILLLSNGADPCHRDQHNYNAFLTAQLWLGVNETNQTIKQNPPLAGIICKKDNHE